MQAVESRPETIPEVREGYSGVYEHSGPFHSFLEHVATYLFPFFVLSVLWVALSHLFDFQAGWTLWLLLPAGWAAGDFVSGMVHWACDTYGSDKTPIFGRALIKPFRLHHKFPRDITTHELVLTIGNSCIAAVPILGVFLYALLNQPATFTKAVWSVLFGVIAVSTVLTNQFHKWAHEESIPPWISLLQKSGLILSPKHHDHHHTAPFETHYCITGGWMNHVLEPLRFFRGLEWLLARIGIHVANR